MVVGRLAPTPSGHLHLGNALAFSAAWLSARSRGGRLLLRFEDVDTLRARAEVEASQREDLRWLGLEWDEEVPRQSERDYLPALQRLEDRLYYCTCTRRQLREAGGVHPQSCRLAGHQEGAVRFWLPLGEVRVVDRRWGTRTVDPTRLGDPVLRRRDGLFTYTHAVVADDVTDGVTEVVRGADLLDFTAVQQRLWEAWGAPPPTWLHCALVLGPDGKKLSKSHGSLELRALRAAGWTRRQVWDLLLPWLGLESGLEPTDAIRSFDPRRLLFGPITLRLPHAGGAPRPEEGVSWSCPSPGVLR